MVAIAQPEHDRTLKAVDEALVRAAKSAPPRTYLGMSKAGHPCTRKLWYDFHWASPNGEIDAVTIKRFEDGHQGEELMARRLRQVDGVELYTRDPDTGQQYEMSGIEGHFRGHLDGAILGLLEAARTWHVWEHKQVGEERFRALHKARLDHGEKGALKAWDEEYYGQAQLYMHYAEMTRHYLTVATPGGRDYISIRTDYDKEVALSIIERAHQAIYAAAPPERLSTDPAFFVCKQCQHHSVCHDLAAPAYSCRTCTRSEVDRDGNWNCLKLKIKLDAKAQIQGCAYHLFTPPLVASGDSLYACESAVIYRHKANGKAFANVCEPDGPEEAVFSANEPVSTYRSRELAGLDPALIADEKLDALRVETGGTIRGTSHAEPK